MDSSFRSDALIRKKLFSLFMAVVLLVGTLLGNVGQAEAAVPVPPPSEQPTADNSTGYMVLDIKGNHMNFPTFCAQNSNGCLTTGSGSNPSVNQVFHYRNVMTVQTDGSPLVLDATVKVAGLTNAAIGNIDASNADSLINGRLNPTVSTPNNVGAGAEGAVLQIDFFDQATRDPVYLKNFFVTLIDLDGGDPITEFVDFVRLQQLYACGSSVESGKQETDQGIHLGR